MAFHNITLAMDLSLSQPGFAILATEENGRGVAPIILEKSFVKTNANKSHGYRLGEISEEIDRYILEYNPEYYVREKGFSRFPNVTQTLFKVVGISDLYAWMRAEKEIHEIAVTSVKKLVAGSGKASKDDVQKAVIERLQIEQADFFSNDDESDAAATALAFYIQKGIIDK